MTYQLLEDGSVVIRYEKDEQATVIQYFRSIRNLPGYDPVAVDELLAILEGTMFFTSNTRH